LSGLTLTEGTGDPTGYIIHFAPEINPGVNASLH
jgi:hypothetical protein